MGMDVWGREPSSEQGKYFRNNVWWWRPLWDYCCDIGAAVISEKLQRAGHFNDGEGLDGPGAVRLAHLLKEELATGRTAIFAAERDAVLAALPQHECTYCNGSGSRTDEVGIRMKMPERMNNYTGKPGWCNGCDGAGKKDDEEKSYGFSVENVEEFVTFLEHCGGFKVC